MPETGWRIWGTYDGGVVSVIFLTGDVHHQSLDTLDQAHLSGTEIKTARKYARIAGRYGVDITLFVSGKTVAETPDVVREVAAHGHVELGGHNWDCFEHSSLHYLSELLLGTHYGPPRYQRWDVRRTLDIVECCTGRRPETWRSHAFIEDDNTHGVLANAGVRVVSNTVAPGRPIEPVGTGLRSLPVNTLPDHSHVYHGHFNREYIRRQHRIIENGPTSIASLGRLPTRDELARTGKELAKLVIGKRRPQSFEREWHTVEEWVDLIKEQVRTQLSARGFATILAHPACMEIADSMAAFEGLCEFLATHETGTVAEAVTLGEGV